MNQAPIPKNGSESLAAAPTLLGYDFRSFRGSDLPGPPMRRNPDKPEPDSDQLAREHASLTLWLVNVLLGVLIGTAYLSHLPEELSTRAWVFVGFGLVSSVGILGLIPALISWLSLRFMASANAQAWVQGLAGAAFLSVMKVDTVVYSLLRYHFFSSAVFNVAVTEGSADAVHLGGHVWIPVILAVSLLTLVQFYVWRHLYRRRLNAPFKQASESIFFRPAALWAFVLLAVVSVEKSIYAAAEFEGDREVNYVSEVLPAYSQLRVSKFLPDGLSGDQIQLTGIEVQEKGTPLAYPHAWPALDPQGDRPNVLFLVIDSWRRDALRPDAMPRLHALAQESKRFENHSAGGNGTRFGIFTMLYGLHGSYWFSALEQGRSPVMIDVLEEEGYDIEVYSSASMNFPEFRDCAWVECLDDVNDDYPAEEPFERDLAVAEDFEAFLVDRRAKRDRGEEPAPFFSFVLLDAAHQPYSYPGEGPFQPTTEGIDYVELSHDRSPALIERMFNRYLNAVHFTDGVAADLIETLRSTGELENTLVVVTGDHGEEFQESSFWGHTSNFTPEQIAVPFFMLGNGLEPGLETRPTSHLDLPPTILELMGADPAQRSRWCLGKNLFNPPAERNLVVSGWDHVGVITPELIFRMRIGGSTATDISVYDQNWQPQNDANLRILQEEAALQRMSEECSRFLVDQGAN